MDPDDGSSPLLNPVILNNVFEHLDHTNLKEVRQVCHRWNGVAAPILTKRSYTILKSACQVNQHQKCYSGYGHIRPLPNGYDDVDHKKLKATLDESANPEVIFQNLHMDFPLLKDVKFLPILEVYGLHVKSVVLKDSAHGRQKDELQQFLHPLLTQYCPTLVHLKVRIQSEDFVSRDDETAPPIMEINESINLESIDIDVQDFPCRLPNGLGFIRSRRVKHELNFLLEVIGKSPELKRLNVTTAPPSTQSLNFCRGISTLVNLEDFGWTFDRNKYYQADAVELKNVMDMFQIICKMKMKKLRILSLSKLSLRNKYITEILPKLLKFFKRNGRNLHTLTLMDVDIGWDKEIENDQLLFSRLEFQEMLTFCPSIATIHIRALPYWYNITDLKSCNVKPCLSLTKLVLSNRTVLTLESFNAIVQWFPNLVYFGLEDISNRYNYEEPEFNEPKTVRNTNLETYLLEVIKTLENLEKLQELEFGGFFFFYVYPELALVNLIQAAKNVPGLRKLTMRDEGGGMGSDKMEELKVALMQTKGFDSVRFENFLMDGDEDKFGITILISENNLPVTFFRKRERCVVVDHSQYDDFYFFPSGPALVFICILFWLIFILYICFIIFIFFCILQGICSGISYLRELLS